MTKANLIKMIKDGMKLETLEEVSALILKIDEIAGESYELEAVTDSKIMEDLVMYEIDLEAEVA